MPNYKMNAGPGGWNDPDFIMTGGQVLLCVDGREGSSYIILVIIIEMGGFFK